MAGTGKIAIDLIKENPVALRPVNRKDPGYIELVDSIRQRGVLNAISVREQQDESGETYYGLVDGLHRFNAAKDAGLTEIPAQIVSLDDAEVEEAQIMANIHKIETKPAEYSKQLMRILSRNPLMTEAELAKRLAKSAAWLRERLGLVKLNAKIQDLVNENDICLSNAYALAKLSEEDQLDFLERAQTQTPTEFCPSVYARVKEVKDAKRKGQDAAPSVFQPQPFMQKVSEIKTEMETGNVGRALIEANNVTDVHTAFALAVAWTLHMDPQSQEAQRAKDEARKAKLEADKAARKKEREEKKAQEARENVLAVAG